MIKVKMLKDVGIYGSGQTYSLPDDRAIYLIAMKATKEIKNKKESKTKKKRTKRAK